MIIGRLETQAEIGPGIGGLPVDTGIELGVKVITGGHHGHGGDEAAHIAQGYFIARAQRCLQHRRPRGFIAGQIDQPAVAGESGRQKLFVFGID